MPAERAAVNDNDQPVAKTMTLTELASGMNMENDDLLERLALVLSQKALLEKMGDQH